MINKGVQKVILRPSDYIAGGETGIVPKEINPSGDWSVGFPLEEPQELPLPGTNLRFETGGCTNFSETNLLEFIGNFKLANNLFSEALVTKCKQLGYIDETGKFNFSDRFLYKMSGTTQQGNQITKGWDAIREFGLVPEKMWPSAGVKNYEEFIIGIPQEIKDFALNFKTLFDTQNMYEWVVTGNCGAPNIALLKEQLKQSPLQVVRSFCGPDANNIVQVCGGCIQQHATVVYNIDKVIKDFDSVFPGKKDLALNYPLIWVLKAVLNEKVVVVPPPPAPFGHVFNIDLKYDKTGTVNPEVVWFQKGLIRLGYKTFATGKFLDMTKEANRKFQKDNDVWNPLIFWYDQAEYFGPKSRAAMNKLLNGF